MRQCTPLLKLVAPIGGLVLVVALAGNEQADCVQSFAPGIVCATPLDCEGLPHDTSCLDGDWQCLSGVCGFKCEPDPIKCVQSGCSGEICAQKSMASFCVWLNWYECLKLTECGNFGPDGTCAWNRTDAFDDCVLSTPCQDGGDCPAGYTCAVGDCSDPNAACDPKCSPQPGSGDCLADADCGQGFACEMAYYCPPCVYGDPPCKAPCWVVGECVQAAKAECKDMCDCYDLYGMKFETPCPLMCPMCGNFWLCEDGKCAEQCGVIPDQRKDCFPLD